MSGLNPSLPLDFKHPFTGEELRDGGIKLAADHADAMEPNWSEEAFKALKSFILGRRDEFMAEDVRKYARAIGVKEPANLRAWGAIFVRASKKEKIIRQVGFAHVKNPNAHCANAAMWIAA
jgi:hypothetical protein